MIERTSLSSTRFQDLSQHPTPHLLFLLFLLHLRLSCFFVLTSGSGGTSLLTPRRRWVGGFQAGGELEVGGHDREVVVVELAASRALGQ